MGADGDLLRSTIMATLADLLPRLTEPFPSDLIDLKPGVFTANRERVLALAYADARVYQERLDQVVGSADWSVAFNLDGTGAICTLTVCGITKADVGDFPLEYGDKALENRATTAAAQAFKRACAQFGLGRYFYALPRLWGDYDHERKCFVDPQNLVRRLYHAAGLTAFIVEPDLPTPHASPTDADRASDAQLGLIARLIIALRRAASDEADVADAIDALGERYQLADLADRTSKERLRSSNLSKTTASTLIHDLKALERPTTLAA
jgi:hypothetical protein